MLSMGSKATRCAGVSDGGYSCVLDYEHHGACEGFEVVYGRSRITSSGLPASIDLRVDLPDQEKAADVVSLLNTVLLDMERAGVVEHWRWTRNGVTLRGRT